MTTNIALQDSLNQLQNSIATSHNYIKNYIDYKDTQLSTNIINDLKNDSDFISDLQTTIYKTAISDLTIDIEKSIVNVKIVQNKATIAITRELPTIKETN